MGVGHDDGERHRGADEEETAGYVDWDGLEGEDTLPCSSLAS